MKSLLYLLFSLLIVSCASTPAPDQPAAVATEE